MHGYPFMQVVQYSVPTCTWAPPPVDPPRPPSATAGQYSTSNTLVSVSNCNEYVFDFFFPSINSAHDPWSTEIRHMVPDMWRNILPVRDSVSGDLLPPSILYQHGWILRNGTDLRSCHIGMCLLGFKFICRLYKIAYFFVF